ncbi:3-keto-disaccharide hydrolase [Cellulomonas soli]|uniref:3-keto-disaccharide hydrolase n=1 Tax=Cellulomonas soli TaxID=931535 RepID=UPI003F849475
MVDDQFVPLFDGTSTAGWRAIPRVYGTVRPGGPTIAEVYREQGLCPPQAPQDHPARWTVEDGVLVGRQDPPGCGYGGYLITERAFGDFELVLETKPDWPADTGVMVRRPADSWEGFQVLLDHRPHGGIGGFFGNGLASFSAVPFTVDVERDTHERPVGLRIDDAGAGPGTAIAHRRAQLSQACEAEEFLRAWRWGEWNELRVRCVGHLPRLTTWVNGLLVAELDTAAIDWPGYDPDTVARTLGPRGHIALEVHDNDPVSGLDRWGADAACRWRNIRIAEL